MVVKGAQNIFLSRVYNSPYIPASFPLKLGNQEEWEKYYLAPYLAKYYKGWQFFPHLFLQFSPHRMEVRLTDPHGMTLDFHVSLSDPSETKLATEPYALTNVMGASPSGRYDPRNTKIRYEENGRKFTVVSADGVVRYYLQKKTLQNFQTNYYLDKEVLANGKVIKYHYDERYKLVRVESLDPFEKHLYASLQIEGTPSEGTCRFISSTGLNAIYHYEPRIMPVKIKEKKRGGYVKQEFNFSCPPLLTAVSSPNDRNQTIGYSPRFLLDSYSGENQVFKCAYAGFIIGNRSQYRMTKLLFPVGLKDQDYPVYEMNYQPPIPGTKQGTTTVKNADGTKVVYHFSQHLLTTSIQFYGQKGELKKEKLFSWDDHQWLQSIEMKDHDNHLLYKKSFEYDLFGNPILEHFTGDLTGQGLQERLYN